MEIDIVKIKHVVYFPPMLSIGNDPSKVEYWNISFEGSVGDISFEGVFRMNDDPISYTLYQLSEEITREFRDN